MIYFRFLAQKIDYFLKIMKIKIFKNSPSVLVALSGLLRAAESGLLAPGMSHRNFCMISVLKEPATPPPTEVGGGGGRLDRSPGI